LDPDIWVDASSSWGIGLLEGNHWAAWRLLSGWQSHGQEIGWDEAISIKLAIFWLPRVAGRI